MNRRVTIETLQMEVEIPEVVHNKANQAFDQIRGNKAEAEADVNIILYSGKQTKIVSRIPKKRIAMIAAVITLAFATVTVAAAYLSWSRSLSEGLRATEEQKVQMEENSMSTFVNQACTDQGITITAVQSITDNYFTRIAFKVEGYEFEEGAQPGFETIDVTVDGRDDISYYSNFYDGLVSGPDGTAVYADGTPLESDENGAIIHHYVMEDGSLEYQIIISDGFEKSQLINKPIHVEFHNLGTLAKAEYFHEMDGTWSFDWELQGSEEMKECTLNAPLGDTNATVVKAELSPISIRVEYEFPMQEVTEISSDENNNEIIVNLYEEPPYFSGVKMKDGSLYPFIGSAGSSGYESEDSDRYRDVIALDRIIDIDQVDSLLFVKSYTEDEEVPTEDNFYEVPIE